MKLYYFYKECRKYANEHTPDVLEKVLKAPLNENTENTSVECQKRSVWNYLLTSFIAAAILMSLSIIFVNIHFWGSNKENGIVPKVTLSPSYNIVYAMQKTYDNIKTIVIEGKEISKNMKTNVVLSNNSWKEIYAGPLNYRYETPDFIRVVNGDKSWNYYKDLNRIEIIPSDPSGSPFLALKSKIDDIAKNDSYKLVGSEKIDGIDTNVIEVTSGNSKNDSWVETYWIDKKTNFILKQETLHNDIKTVITYKTDFALDIDKESLKPNFPSNVPVIDRLTEFDIFHSINDAQKAVNFDIIVPDKIPKGFKLFEARKYKNESAIELDYYNEDFTKFIFIQEYHKDKTTVNIMSNLNDDVLKQLKDDLNK
ncbi:LolA family protein [Thermoanaerobacterium thermosaccharolyticum]|uniref:Uncharacterized protein TP-0789 domain-containing protein n=1 Tax=Thermoanaerobacterium thermosaccharolyticum M0795 TaxID=698948 RepID=L0IJH4_THETR|nr:outer membrane lipoprotein-sorting protein [Thermoanaerobacterium thermosaccharolyticum]AGB19665.1 hypothetical protein Thethe_02074 [Thermoanaerobacterium thermosaccharolyticum M0795]